MFKPPPLPQIIFQQSINDVFFKYLLLFFSFFFFKGSTLAPPHVCTFLAYNRLIRGSLSEPTISRVTAAFAATKFKFQMPLVLCGALAAWVSMHNAGATMSLRCPGHSGERESDRVQRAVSSLALRCSPFPHCLPAEVCLP